MNESTPIRPDLGATKATLEALPAGLRKGWMSERLKTEIAATFQIDEEFLSDDDKLAELGADSLRLVTLVLRLEQLVGFSMPPALLPRNVTIGELSELLVSALLNPDPLAALMKGRREALLDEIRADVFLAPGTGDTPRKVSAAELLEPKSLLLTGATGFVGAYLLTELARRTTARIHCLVRARSEAEGIRRIEDNLKHFGLAPEVMSRVTVEIGDLDAPGFGLAAERYKYLAENLDVVYHNGANVHLTHPYEVMRPANVAGTRTILHLAGTGRIKPVALVSTVGLFDTPELENVSAISEAMTPADIAILPNGYTQSKLAGEWLAALAQQAGIPVAIFRVGHVIGAGVSQDLAGRLLESCVAARAIPDFAYPIDYVTPTYVASAIVAIARQREKYSATYHVTNPHPITMESVRGFILLSPVPVRTLSLRDWLSELHDQAVQDPAHPMFAAADALAVPKRPGEKSFVEQVLSRPRIDCEQASSALTESGVSCPSAAEILRGVIVEMPEIRAFLTQSIKVQPPA